MGTPPSCRIAMTTALLLPGLFGALLLTDHAQCLEYGALAAPQAPGPPLPPGATRQGQFLAEFLAEGRDPRSLPRVAVSHIDAFGPMAPGSLGEALAVADLVIVGRVTSTRFCAATPPGGLPRAMSTVSVDEAIKGVAAPSVVVTQLGGPALVASGDPQGREALGQMENDPLLLPGDEVLLFLTYNSLVQTYNTIPSVGVYFVHDGRLVPNAWNRFGTVLAGRSVADAVALIHGTVPQAGPQLR